MNIGFFIIGAVIFAVYLGLMVWNIVYSSKKQQEENYPNINLDESADDSEKNINTVKKMLLKQKNIKYKLQKINYD